jgi:hypothetical protein
MYRAITATFCVLVLVVTCKPNEAGSGKHASAYEKSFVSLTFPHTSNPATHTSESKADSPHWYAPFERPDWLLVFVGVGTLIFIGVQAREMKRATQAMKESTTEVKRQADIMERQTKATEDTAKAARDNMDLLVAKERACIEIEPRGWKICATVDPLPYSSVTFAVRCHGATRAEIVEAVARATVSDSCEAPLNKTYLPMSLAPTLISGSTTEKEAFLFDDLPEIEEEVSSSTFGDPRMIIHFWGYVRYADIFGGRWKRSFRYMWAPPNPYGGGQWQGGNEEIKDQ